MFLAVVVARTSAVECHILLPAGASHHLTGEEAVVSTDTIVTINICTDVDGNGVGYSMKNYIFLIF